MSQEVFAIVFPHWIRAFVFTLAVEIPIFVLLGRRLLAPAACPLWRLALAGAAGTCVTHPLLWFVWPLVISDYTVYIATGELIVAATESLTFFLIARPIRMGRAAVTAFAANAASWGLGALMHRLASPG